MVINSVIIVLLIFIGIVIMSINIKMHYTTYKHLRLIPKIKRKLINRLCNLHLTLMCSFLLGYAFLEVSILFKQVEFGLMCVGLILFFGAFFVFIGILVQSKMLNLINETYLQTIKALTNAMDFRDKYTMGHSQHVANLSILICEKMIDNFNCDKDMLEYAGLLHDIGKIGIPEEILNKSSKLNDCEFDIMKKHVQIGYEIIKNINGLDEISEWILYHHERIDGKGYYNLNKDEIPLESKIISIADTFSALVTNRPYRQGMKYENAIEIMKESSDKQLDSKILEVFLKIPFEEIQLCIPNKLKIH